MFVLVVIVILSELLVDLWLDLGTDTVDVTVDVGLVTISFVEVFLLVCWVTTVTFSGCFVDA